MFSKLTRKFILIAGNSIWFGGGAPCYFKTAYNRFVPSISNVSTSPFRKGFELAHNLVNRLYILFVGYRLASQISAGAPTSIILQTLYVLLCYMAAVILDFQIILKHNLPYQFTEAFMHYFRNIENEYGLSKKGTLVKCNKFLTILFLCGNLIFLQNFSLMRKYPKAPHLLTSLLTDQHPKFYKLPLMLAQIWIWYNLLTDIYFYIFPIYVYTCCAIRLVRELK